MFCTDNSFIIITILLSLLFLITVLLCWRLMLKDHSSDDGFKIRRGVSPICFVICCHVRNRVKDVELKLLQHWNADKAAVCESFINSGVCSLSLGLAPLGLVPRVVGKMIQRFSSSKETVQSDRS